VNRTVFDDLAQRCAKRRRCLTLGWRGHGESERPVLDFAAADHGHSTPPSFCEAQQEFAKTHNWFRAYELDAQSHLPMFEVPEDMARLIEEFVG
jgi:hypothetical protein